MFHRQTLQELQHPLVSGYQQLTIYIDEARMKSQVLNSKFHKGGDLIKTLDVFRLP